jgi:uncharacterized protein (TIGR00369 family)
LTVAARWTAQDPAFEASVRASFARQAMMATLGARIVHLAPGEVDLAAPFAPQFGQQNGFWHAGAVAGLADSANGYAAFSLAPPGSDVLAVEFKINLLAPARGARFVACGRVVRPGRTLAVCHADVFAEPAAAEGDDGEGDRAGVGDGGMAGAAGPVARSASARILIATMSSTLIMRAIERGVARE